MRIRIKHRTELETTGGHALNRLRLSPPDGHPQTVIAWSLDVSGAVEEVSFSDHLSNETRLISTDGAPHPVIIEATGEVDTRDTAGVSGAARGYAPLWLFRRETARTAAGPSIEELVGQVNNGSELDKLHALMGAVGERIAFEENVEGDELAEAVLAKGKAPASGSADVFISAARLMGFSARCVSGYLVGETGRTTCHAWAEAHVEGLGWVAFDPVNGMSPDERYVRLALGRDYGEAMPLSGMGAAILQNFVDAEFIAEQ